MNTKIWKQFMMLTVAVMMLIPMATVPVPADYIPLTEYADENGNSGVLYRSNNNNYGVGWIGNPGFDDVVNPLTMMMSTSGLPDIRGAVCTDLDEPAANLAEYSPTQVRLEGEVYSLDELNNKIPWKNETILDAVFVPLDINDNNTIVGNVFYEYEADGQVRVGAVPFIADGPNGIPTLIVGQDDGGQILPLPGLGTWLDSAVVTGINNNEDITGMVCGLMTDNNGNGILVQGFSTNRADVDDDGLLTGGEVSMYSGGGNVFTFPLGISNSGKIAGMSASLRYPLANGTFLTDGSGNYLLTDDDVRIPAGEDNLSSLAENLTAMKYVKLLGFVVDSAAGDGHSALIDSLDDAVLLEMEAAGTAEVYGKFIYNILDSDQVLEYTVKDPDSGRPAALFTMTELVGQIMAFLGQSTEPTRQLTDTSQARFSLSSPPHYESDLTQGMDYPESSLAGLFDINAAGVALGIYADTTETGGYVYLPGVCREDNGGSIDIMGRPACVTPDGSEPIYVPVRVQNAPNEVYALGFEVSYDTGFLEFAGFVTDPANSLPVALLDGWQAGGENSWQGEELGEGLVRIGAYTTDTPIRANQDGILGYLAFYSSSPEVTRLEIQGLVDDIAGWTASDGCLFKVTGDCNADGEVTPADALCAFEKGMAICDTTCGPCWEVPGDVDQDNDTDMYDALCIFEYYLGLPSCLD
ncbi:MAG: cohesin domain-containing protein [Desulfosudaceae bacterium]